MRLSEIKGEDAIEVIADIIEPIAIIAADKDFEKERKAKKPMLMLVKYVLKKHRQSVIEILAALDMKTVEEYLETVNVVSLPKQIMEALNDPEVMSLFQSQSQTEKTSFGSVMESTEASEK